MRIYVIARRFVQQIDEAIQDNMNIEIFGLPRRFINEAPRNDANEYAYWLLVKKVRLTFLPDKMT